MASHPPKMQRQHLPPTLKGYDGHEHGEEELHKRQLLCEGASVATHGNDLQ
jgi:hypothetical protein